MFQHIGSCIHGTLQQRDLIPAFFDLLLEIDKEKGTDLWYSWRGELSADWGVLISDTPGNESPEQWEGILDCLDPETGIWIVEELVDALNDLAPTGVYFGASAGDGADFGYWPMWDLVETEYPKVSDPSELDALPMDIEGATVVNDHGNVTFYVPVREWAPVWEIV